MLTSYYRSGDTLRSRHVSTIVPSGQLDIPAPGARLLADWQRETSLNMVLEPGDVEPMPLARARARWPDYPRCVQAMADWTGALGLPDVLAASDVALMACRGARFHHDANQYGDAAFCNLFLSEDQGLDLLFPALDRRIPLGRGTAVMFDTGQPHGVVRRGSRRFDPADFATRLDRVQIFLTWELPIEHAQVAQALQIAFDTAPAAALQPDDEQVRLDDEPVVVCPASGDWQKIRLRSTGSSAAQ
jgi:hypothetical protein